MSPTIRFSDRCAVAIGVHQAIMLQFIWDKSIGGRLQLSLKDFRKELPFWGSFAVSSNLEKLEKGGLIEVDRNNQAGNVRTAFAYSLTKAGKELVI